MFTEPHKFWGKYRNKNIVSHVARGALDSSTPGVKLGFM